MSGASRKAKSSGKIRFGKVTAPFFSLSSDGITRAVESSGEEEDECHEDKFEGKTLGQIFSMNHANLTEVVMDLMQERGLRVLAQRLFLDDKYFETGKFEKGDDLELISVGMTSLCALGKLEQALLAGLQIIYHYAKNKRLNGKFSAEDATGSLHHNKESRFTRFDVTYELNGYTSKLAVVEEGNECYISLYVED